MVGSEFSILLAPYRAVYMRLIFRDLRHRTHRPDSCIQGARFDDVGVAHCLTRFGVCTSGVSFEGFAQAVSSIPDEEADEHFRSQHVYVTNDTGRIAVDLHGPLRVIGGGFYGGGGADGAADTGAAAASGRRQAERDIVYKRLLQLTSFPLDGAPAQTGRFRAPRSRSRRTRASGLQKPRQACT